MLRLAFAAFGVISFIALAFGNANAAETWQQTLDKAKSQTLNMNDQGNPAFDAVIDAFTKKYGIKVDVTVARPSMAITRFQTEQQNGSFIGDIWWAITGLMTTVAAPTGMFEPFDDYLVLPEVKDLSNWRDPDYIFGDATHFVFTYMHEVNRAVYRNRAVLPELKIDTVDSLMSPELKGKVALRDSSLPNAGSYALAAIYKAKGGDFLEKFLRLQEPRVYANPEQLDTAFIRGGAALSVGGQAASYSQCRNDGGCKSIESIESMASTISRGFAVMKNAPHPEAAKVFINWILSKEGQQLLVQEWAKANVSGAVSMRKDVPPAPGYEQDLPDFANPDHYVWVSTERGDEEVNAVTKIFRAWNEK